MAKLSDEELLQKYDDLEWNEHKFYTSSAYKKEYASLRAEILKRMEKVDVAGIAREICEKLAATKSKTNWMAYVKVILRSHLEGKSE